MDFILHVLFLCFFCFKQKTAYEMRISDWSSDVCSSDLHVRIEQVHRCMRVMILPGLPCLDGAQDHHQRNGADHQADQEHEQVAAGSGRLGRLGGARFGRGGHGWLLFGSGDDSMRPAPVNWRSEEHTSELQSLMRISYAVFCLKKKKK